MLCTCCLSASSLEIQTGIFSKTVTLWTALQIPFWSKPHLVFLPIKFTKSHSVKCSLHKWVQLRRSIEVSSFELYKFDPFSPHSGSIPWKLVHSYVHMSCTHIYIGYLSAFWVWVACELWQFAATQQAGMVKRTFCRPHAYTFNEQSKMATALTPQTDVTSVKVMWLMENLQKIKSIKNQHTHLFSHFLLH